MKLEEVLLEMYTAYVLDDASRARLAEKFPPRYSKWIGHHVTVQFGVPADTEAPEQADIRVVGHVDSGDGLEALVVMVNGEKRREDGSVYHITWSLDPESGYKPKDSNDLIRGKQYTIVRHIPIGTQPAVLK